MVSASTIDLLLSIVTAGGMARLLLAVLPVPRGGYCSSPIFNFRPSVFLWTALASSSTIL